MKISSGYEQRHARVEILPLIDIIFLLLVFFIYSMLLMTVQYGVDVNLATSANMEVDRTNRINISITSNNEIFINGKPVDQGSLLAKLESLGARAGAPILLNGDVKADFGVALEIFDQLREAGFGSVALGYKKE